MHFVKIVLMILAFAAVSEMDYQDAVKVEQIRTKLLTQRGFYDARNDAYSRYSDRR